MAEEAIKVTVAATITVSQSACYKNVHALLQLFFYSKFHYHVTALLVGGVRIYSYFLRDLFISFLLCDSSAGLYQVRVAQKRRN